MEGLVFPAPAPPVVPVAGGGLFPVRRIFCVGRNYAAHVREMGGDPAREPPLFFMKPADSVLIAGAPLAYPPASVDLHHEIELVAAIGKGGAEIAMIDALDFVFGYAAGLDMTRRDLQAAAKAAGRPWDLAKGFDHSAPIGTIAQAEAIGHPARGAITLHANETLRQQGDLSEMIWSVAEIIAALSAFVRLAPGDLLFTGTPSGVGAVARGDRLDGRIEGVGTVRTVIV